MRTHFLGIDVGTSGTKALLIDGAGRVVATAAAEHEQLSPAAGWSEQRPGDWWDSTRAAVRKGLRAAKLSGGDVGGVGLSGQMHGSVFLDARGRPLCNAILWNDQRTGEECAEIERRAGGRARLIQMVRNPALTGYTAPKILWLRRRRRRVFERVRTVLLPKDYVRYRLTGTLGGDVSDASGTLLFDVARRCWSVELMERLELDPGLFPPVVESQTVIGGLTREAGGALGLAADTPVVAGAGDQAAAAVGTGVVKRGVVSATIGTSGVVFAHSDTPVANEEGLLQSFCHAVPGKWCVFGCMLSAGGSLAWARRVLYASELAAARTERARDAIYKRMIAEAAGDDGVATRVSARPTSGTGAGRYARTSGTGAGRYARASGTDEGDREGSRNDAAGDSVGPTSGTGAGRYDARSRGRGSRENKSVRGTLLFLPYLTGERCPYPHPHARGAWIGLEAGHTRGDMVRAVLEGVTIGMGRQVQMMRGLGVPIREVRLAGGGARSAWWRQLQADVYGCRCVRLRSEEGSAMGAALLAAVGTGRFKSVEAACATACEVAERYEPDRCAEAEYARLARSSAEVYERVEPVLRGETWTR